MCSVYWREVNERTPVALIPIGSVSYAMVDAAVTLLVISDLDGTLLAAATYSYEAAAKALEKMRRMDIPLVLASSKTRAEMEPIRAALGNRGPFIIENGGAVYIPCGLFPFSLPGTSLRGSYYVKEFGTPYEELRAALKDMAHLLGRSMKGFGDMSVEEVSERTGLSHADALLSKQREYDEPFVIDGPAVYIEEFRHLAEARGLVCTRGGRFLHLLGPTDKGAACSYLIECYSHMRPQPGKTLRSIGVGDSVNDLPMLKVVDQPILVQRADGTYDPDVQLAYLIRAPGIGPAGWNEAILHLLQ